MDIKIHFIWDLVGNDLSRMEFIETNNLVGDIFKKPLNFERFSNLMKSLIMYTLWSLTDVVGDVANISDNI